MKSSKHLASKLAARKTRKARTMWIAGAHVHKGALHRALGFPPGEKIPLARLKSAAKEPGRLGRMARLALRFRAMKHPRARSRRNI
jgi:hypothetical protein